MDNKPKIGFIGLGAMGLGMASCLVKSGFDVTGFDINENAMEKFASHGGRAASTPSACAAAANILVIVVATSDQASSVLFDPHNGGLRTLPPNSTVLLCITADPAYILDVESRLKASKRADVRLIDCPISGGEARAQQGTLSLLCAGKGSDVEYVWDVLSCIGSQIHVIPGGIGAGSSVKMVHQILVGVHILACVEVMGLAYVAGLDMHKTYDSVMGGDAASWLFGQRAAHMLDKGEVPASSLMIITKDFSMVEASAHADDDCTALNTYLMRTGSLHSLRESSHLSKHPSKTINEAVITSLLIGIHAAASIEVLKFAQRLGLDSEMVRDIVRDAAGHSAMFEKVCAQLQGKSDIFLRTLDNYEDIAQDLSSAIDIAKSAKYPLFFASAALQQFYSS
ncbi:hypothetical protein FE257_012416 [Aspergillus nanangensis]|uniref:Uncharacterized protein n=1 Tax=Aspergillus nanangensis TaxID=2582783 RepID=A0AAD4GXR4_ASPNN|nr:hypothetical protein FE257_012416 [Aspergillus nanangensis]